MKLAIVTPQPTPYRDPFWNAVAGQPGVELDVFYCYQKTSERPWERDWEMRFRAHFLPSMRLLPGGNGYYNRGLARVLRQGQYDAFVLGGYNHVSMLVAALVARRRRIPYFLMSEVYLAQPRALWRKIVKWPLVRWMVRGAAGCLPTGSLASRYLIHYGAKENRLCRVPNAPDIDGLNSYAAGLPADYLRAERAKQGVDGRAALFVGRLIPLKRVDVLLRAAALVKGPAPLTVLIAGDGPVRPALEELVRQLGISERVRFLGFLQPSELPYWYCLSDVFVLPSEDETWGVVVLESLACGTPVVATQLVGSAPDAIPDSAFGSIVAVGDAQAMAEAIDRHTRSPQGRDRLRAAWQPVADTMRHATVARRLVEFVHRTIAERQPVGSGEPTASGVR